MRSSQNAPKVIAIALRAAVKVLNLWSNADGGEYARAQRTNALDSIEAAATELEGMAGEGPSYLPPVRCSACGLVAPAGRLVPGTKHHDGGTWEATGEPEAVR